MIAAFSLLLCPILEQSAYAQEIAGSVWSLQSVGAGFSDYNNISIAGRPGHVYFALERSLMPDTTGGPYNWTERALHYLSLDTSTKSVDCGWEVAPRSLLVGSSHYASIGITGANSVELIGKYYPAINPMNPPSWGPQAISYSVTTASCTAPIGGDSLYVISDPGNTVTHNKPHILRDTIGNRTHVCLTRTQWDPTTQAKSGSDDMTSKAKTNPAWSLSISRDLKAEAPDTEDHCMMAFKKESESNYKYTVFHNDENPGADEIRIDMVRLSGIVWLNGGSFALNDSVADFPSIFIREHGDVNQTATFLVAANSDGARVAKTWKCVGTRAQCNQASEFGASSVDLDANGNAIGSHKDVKIFQVRRSPDLQVGGGTHDDFMVYERLDDGPGGDGNQVFLASRCDGETAWTEEGFFPIFSSEYDPGFPNEPQTYLGTPQGPQSIGSPDFPSVPQASVHVEGDQFWVGFLTRHPTPMSNDPTDRHNDPFVFQGKGRDYCPHDP